MNENDKLLSQLPKPPAGKTGWPWTKASSPLTAKTPDGSPWPKISIVTPSYNQAEYIEETIRSVLLQGYPNLEYIIIDGGSTDGSVDTIKKYEPWLTYWVSEKDRGQTYAIAKGMQQATGDLVNWLNSDDLLVEGALIALAITYRTINTDLAVLCGHRVTVDQNGNELSRSQSYFRSEEDVNFLPQSPQIEISAQASAYYTKKAWDYIGGINLSLDYTMDTDLYYRAHAAGIQFFIVDNYISAFRLHELTKTHNGWQKSIQYKKNFYYSKLEELSNEEQNKYKKRIKKLLYGYYTASVWQSDSFLLRTVKLLGAVKVYPRCLVEPFRLKRLLNLLFNRY